MINNFGLKYGGKKRGNIFGFKTDRKKLENYLKNT